ncbi:MAG TPA: purine-nucleoside phosphorylase [Verrucomicrobiae bacterium]|nr:purine-nucleoside phosphorylase [Verrucomicrobiae bacterium]
MPAPEIRSPASAEIDPAEASNYLKKLTRLRPSLALVLGTGFQGIAADIRATAEVDYSRIPGFAPPGVEGHPGKLTIGYLGSAPILILNGRAHYYEGHDMATVTFPIRVLADFGVRDLVLTNAAGGINSRFKPGDFMLVSDHVNFMGTTPLRGLSSAGKETRFVDLTNAYDARLSGLLSTAARQEKIQLRAGVYAAVCGPCYETPAEVRALRRIGADAVGMSTVPEVIVARHCGLAVAALSCITNPAAGRNKKPLTHEEVLAVGRKAQSTANDLFRRFVESYASRK